MEIYVEGRAERAFSPEVIHFDFNYEIREKTYEKVMTLGSAEVDRFFSFMQSLGYKKSDIKTRAFRVYEDIKYDYASKKNINNGFVYSQRLRLDTKYDIEKMTKIMAELASLKNPPKYTITFALRDDETAKNECIQEAFKKAKARAEAIAKASGTTINKCEKVSLTPFDAGEHISNTRYDGAEMMMKSASVADSIQNTFVPEDITVDLTLYCIFSSK